MAYRSSYRYGVQAGVTSDMPDRRSEPREWRGLFSEEVLVRAQRPEAQTAITRFTAYDWRCDATIRDAGNRQVVITNPPLSLEETWEDASFQCHCIDRRQGKYCWHLAAVMLRWEKEHGPWMAWESPWKYQERKKQEEQEKERSRREKMRKSMDPGTLPVTSFLEGGKSRQDLVLFDIDGAAEGFVTTPYAVARAKDILKEFSPRYDAFQVEENRAGDRLLHISCVFHDLLGYVYVEGLVRGGEMIALHSRMSGGYVMRRSYVRPGFSSYERAHDAAEEEWAEDTEAFSGDGEGNGSPRQAQEGREIPWDEFQLAAVYAARDYLYRHPEVNQIKTDGSAHTFFSAMERAGLDRIRDTEEEGQDERAEKQTVLRLKPRIVIDEGQAKLSFKIGRDGGRMYVLRNLGEVSSCYIQENTFAVTKKEVIDFRQQDFAEEDVPLMQFIARRVGEVGDANEKLMSKARSYGRVSTLSIGGALDLKGSLLDNFYDIAEGKRCEYLDKSNNIEESEIPVGHQDMSFGLRIEDVKDARNRYAGVMLSGLIPVLIGGSVANYILNARGLSRISAQEEHLLSPFHAVADPSGAFRFTIGRDSLQEFYYRVLPTLLANGSVLLDDLTSGEAQKYLPPEPDFTFYLDYEDGWLLAHTRVRYGEQEYILDPNQPAEHDYPAGTVLDPYGKVIYEPGIPGSQAGGKTHSEKEQRSQAQTGTGWGDYRDTYQEQRVFNALQEQFDQWDKGSQQYLKNVTERELYQFLTVGMEQLGRFGNLKGTEAFRRLNVRQAPKVSVGISVESGLMELTVLSKDMTPRELTDILESYRRKKRYHRLSSGTFVDLTRESGLGEVDALLRGMDLSAEEVMGGKAKLPLYRALYLDKLMEEHDALSASRDRTYRALIRSFKTVRDAEFELPASLEDTLRSYQSYGFKWMKTLQAAGFGGILADEMGLGKTLQTISVFLSDYESGCDKPSLVACPASLVYNWEEEIRRFAPALKTIVMSGTGAARKKLLQQVTDGGADVCIISYDTLKRDITQYKEIAFHNFVLDEAQYIKNPRAAVSKAVKGIRSAHRFALTGTPIENRLSELWSIFDFLMPGFLYSMSDFSQKFETHIVKEKDAEVTEKLKRMIRPFVLRRCKADVLADLPAKLEEVRYARVEGEQQRIYDAQVVRMKQMLEDPDMEDGEGRIKILAELTRIRQICCDPSLLLADYRGESAKRTAALELIRSAMDGGHRMLLFSQFTSMLELLEEDLKREGIAYYVITGATPKEKRMALVHAFNEGDVPVFLISLKAGGNGLNLTGADVVIHYDPWWNLAAQNQATDRAHRIGQTRQVTVYRLILKDTIEERILDLQNAKKDLADAILEGKHESIMRMSNEELLALLG